MSKKLLICALCCCSVGANANDLSKQNNDEIVASFDLSGSEVWHGYFLPDDVYLVEQEDNDSQHYKLINHPPYIEQEGPVHRLVCDDRRTDENDQQDRCRDEFPHVHVNELKHVHYTDFIIASDYAQKVCEGYGSGVGTVFLGPSTFVEINDSANSHSYLYNLNQGLSFDCVVQAFR